MLSELLSLACLRSADSTRGLRPWEVLARERGQSTATGLPRGLLTGPALTKTASRAAFLATCWCTDSLPSVTGTDVQTSGGAVRCCQNFYRWHACGHLDTAEALGLGRSWP